MSIAGMYLLVFGAACLSGGIALNYGAFLSVRRRNLGTSQAQSGISH